MQVAVKPSYIDNKSSAMVQLVETLHAVPGNTLLLLVEQEVAMHATAFVGTPSSSATWVQVQERVGKQIGGSAGKGKRRKGGDEGRDADTALYMFPEEFLRPVSK